MARTTVDAQISKIRKQMEALHAKEKALLSKANDKVIAQIVALAKKHGITHDELGEAMDAAKTRRTAKGSRHNDPKVGKAKNSGDMRGKVAPKYRNPSNPSETWTGRGRSPLWVQAMKDAGTLDTALIKMEG